MSIFNSLGSNYSGAFVKRSLRPFLPGRVKTDLTQKLQADYQAQSVILTYKGREAITLILKQFQLPADSYVAVNGYTCYVVYAAIEAAGYKPYLIDIPTDSLNFSAAALEQAFKAEPNIQAVVIQNTLGMPADIAAIKALCDQHKLPLIEDLAHSAGLVYPTGEQAGEVGDAAALSFSQDKIIDAVSGGAAIFKTLETTAEPSFHVSQMLRWQAFWYPLNTHFIRATHRLGLGKIWLKMLRTFKLLPNQMAGDPGHIRALPKRQAYLALTALQNLQTILEHRQAIAEVYRQALPANIQLPHQNGALYIRFPLLVDNPRDLEKYLKDANIYIGNPWYDAVIAPGRYMELTHYQPGQCPNAESIAAHIVNLPTHINISEQQAKELAGKVNEWLTLQSNQ
ncbi:MAG TPA: DegT/DnrJ/EryC1/StrS family aminotransferase [Patescibacteria group bacterium]|nr:DegT/DnrJ/EryC1/StrS family aminotransferase [Patescibacteria group bacterium]